MKKILLLLALVVSFTAVVAQKSKPAAKPVKAATEVAAKPDSVSLTVSYDTTQAVAIVYSDGGVLIWKKAYVISRTLSGSNQLMIPAGQTLVDEHFQAIRPEVVYDVKPRTR